MDEILTTSVSKSGHVIEMPSSPIPDSGIENVLPLTFVNVDLQHMEGLGQVSEVMPFTVNGDSRSGYR